MSSAILTEANILIDISFSIKQRYRTNVTIIPVSRIDDVTNLLTTGPIIIFQFNKPYSYSSDRNINYTKFIIETKQHQALLQRFKPNQAFYIFVALNSLSEIISNRKDLMKYCIAIDIHNIPTGKYARQKTRVIRMVKSSLCPKLEIAGSRRFEAISKLLALKELSSQFIKGLVGIIMRPGLPIDTFMEKFESITYHMYAIHLRTESAAAS
jgi:hypothetical protein